ncbi:L-fuculokinase [Akkermansia glycaniphila]|uniref:L-fuculokinase n=1 Tax=Akkermansia glycaniphila TaxID=1679444 RepID=UPI001C0098B4|nr:L-fuculokinase [Akkermansia glycaniphila]MBT9448802.1 L-fuculokinase [Akkermansia glycaniphila]
MLVLCLDCGATNVRAMIVDDRGRIVGKASQPNSTKPGDENPGYHIWDADRILAQLSACAREALATVDASQVKAVTITTFGVDGALVDEKGSLLYPVISWKCPRTAEIMKRIGDYIPQDKLNALSGVGEFAFNTIYKLVWLKENRPELLDRAHAWLFISNILAHRLTGVMATDRTMAGTSQLTDLRTGNFSDEILQAIGVRKELFPPIVNAGKTIGALTPEAAANLGLPASGIPVVSTGHDTQFAVFGSGAEKNQPVLSSGTWEILMVRAEKADLGAADYAAGATAEYDSDPALLNPGLQWIASGIIEWVKSTCYQGANYDTMDEEAAAIAPGSDGVRLIPNFLPSDPMPGSIEGLILGRTRGHIYRAAMEALTYRLKTRLARLESVGGFKAASLLLVGGGARNKIWTQMRADVLGMPILVSKVSESTVLGASMFAFSGAGIYPSPEAARTAFGIEYDTYLPGAQQADYATLAASMHDA